MKISSIIRFISYFVILPVVVSDIVQIQKFSISDFIMQTKYELFIDQQFSQQQLIIEVTFQQKSTNAQKEQQFIFLATEPNQTPKEYYDVLFQQKIQDYEQNKIHIDIEGYSTMRKFQQVHIIQLTDQQIGIWDLRFYDLKSDKVTAYNININIYSYTKNEIYCPDNCNKSLTFNQPILLQNTCNKDQGLQKNYCSCGEGYIGYTCYFNSPFNEVDEDINVKIDPLTWSMKQFNISDYSDSKFSLMVSGSFTKIKMSIVYGTQSELKVPNILFDSYDISASNGNENQEYPPIQDKIKKMFSSDTQSTNKMDQVITVGFYNQNPTTETKFIFRLKIVETASEDISGLNKTTIILFIVFGCVLIFCVTPITYFCVKQKKRQEQEFLNQMLGNGQQNQQQSQNSNQLRQINSQNSRQQGNNINQNDILDQQNHPPQIGRNQGIDGIRSANIFIGLDQNSENRNIVGSAALIQNMPIERPKPIKKIVPITKETINRFMPKQLYQDVLRLYPTLKDEGEDCTVCLETFEQSSECRITPCYHLFHADCLESWFQKHSTCPYCRNSCNRKGQRNAYVKRIQQPFQKINSKQIKSDGDIEADDLNTNRLDDLDNPQTHSPGRRANEFVYGPENEKNNQQIGLQDINVNDEIKIDCNINNSSAQKPQKKSSIVETVLQAINKPFQSFRREISSPQLNIQQQENHISQYKHKERLQEQGQNSINNNIIYNEVQQNLASNNSMNKYPNNNQFLSINCMSQNAFIEGGNDVLSFASPNLSQLQGHQAHEVQLQSNQNDILFSLNNSMQRRFSLGGEPQQINNIMSAENSFQIVSTTRKMFAEQEQLNNINQNYQQNSQRQSQKELNFEEKGIDSDREMENFDPEREQQISYRRQHMDNIYQKTKFFISKSDLINDYNDGNIENTDEENKSEFKFSFQNQQNLYASSKKNQQFKKQFIQSEKKAKKNNELNDTSIIPFTENDLSQRSNQKSLPVQNNPISQPKFIQDLNRRESGVLNSQQSEKSMRNKGLSFMAENVQSSILNRTGDEKRHESHSFKINIQNYLLDEFQTPTELIQLSDITSSKPNSSIDQKSSQGQQLKNIQVVNKLIVLEDDDEDDSELQKIEKMLNEQQIDNQ